MKLNLKDAAGVEHEVELDEENLPKGLMTEAQFGERFATELARRGKSLEKKAREGALADEAFKEQALTAWGISPEVLKGGDLNKDKIANLRAEWAKAELDPIKGQLASATTEIETMRSNALVSEIIEGARGAGVKEQYLKSLGANSKPLIVAAIRDRYGFDPETKGWFTKEGDGFAFSRSGKTPYRTVAEDFAVLADDKAFEDFFEKKKPSGPNARPGGSGPDVFISRADARDHSKFTAAEAQAEKSGGQVRYTD